MRRREFISLFGGALTAWPLRAQGQQGERMRIIGMLMPILKDDRDYLLWIAACRQAMQELGWIERRNMRIDIRWPPQTADLRKQSAELAALAPDVILAHGSSAVSPLLQATRTVPIVFPVIVDPVAGGFVASLA